MDDWGIVDLLSVTTATERTRENDKSGRLGMDEGLQVFVDGPQVAGGICREARRSITRKQRRCCQTYLTGGIVKLLS